MQFLIIVIKSFELRENVGSNDCVWLMEFVLFEFVVVDVFSFDKYLVDTKPYVELYFTSDHPFELLETRVILEFFGIVKMTE